MDNSDIQLIPSDLKGQEAVQIRRMDKSFETGEDGPIHAVNG